MQTTISIVGSSAGETATSARRALTDGSGPSVRRSLVEICAMTLRSFTNMSHRPETGWPALFRDISVSIRSSAPDRSGRGGRYAHSVAIFDPAAGREAPISGDG